jgi:hypothetical protein
MSLPSTSRTSLFRRGLVALATATTLLAGGLVAAPAAQAALPLVDTSERDGTVVTTRMFTATTNISAVGKKLEPVFLWYDIKLGWTGGKFRAFDGEVTLQRVGASGVRRIPVTLDADGYQKKRITLPGTISPGFYHVGIEFTAAVERPDGKLNLHRVDVNSVKKHSIRRDTWIKAEITNPEATDGRASRITGSVRALRLSRDGNVSWSTLREGAVHLSYDPDGPWEDDKKVVYVRKLTIGPDGKFSTVVPAREGTWELRYRGSDWLHGSLTDVPNGGGCGC